MPKDLVPNSYVRPISPKAQFRELNASLAVQVQDTRRNLLGALKDAGPLLPFTMEEDSDVGSTSKDVAPKALEQSTADECIKVYLKIRPFKEDEIARMENKNCIEIKSQTMIAAHPPPESNTYKNSLQLYGSGERDYSFTFSRVFPDGTKQKQFFDETTQQFIRNVLIGQDALLFSYGVTNGGKTYTFQGTENAPGLVPRSVSLLFQSLHDKLIVEPERMPKMFGDCEFIDGSGRQEMKATKAALWKFLDTGEYEVLYNQTTSSVATTFMTAGEGSLGSSSSNSTQSLDDCGVRSREPSGNSLTQPNDYRCSVWVSFVEIYNEQVYDLLVPFTGAKGKDRPTLKVSEDRRGNVYIKGANEYFITSVEEAIKLVMVGRRNLQNAATKLNYNSSRSHCIYAIRLLKEFVRPDGTITHQINRLSFCDLAGSERTKKIEGGCERAKETGSINASLLTLGKCIRILRWNQVHKNQPQIIPYRESKLTRLFQHYLSARAQTCMVVNINQCASCFDETLNVLKFSAVAKEIKTIREPLLPPVVASPPPALKFSLLWKEVCDRKRTLAWATGASKKSDVVVASDQSVSEPLPDEDEDAAGDDILDQTLDANNEVIQQYLRIIEDLRVKLINEKKNSYLLEEKIRAEVCEEYGRLYREMERHYKDDREEAVADTEQLAEDRIELFVQSVRNRRKTEGRVVMNDNDTEGEEDAWIPAESIQAKEKECEDLRQQVQNLQAELAAITGGASSQGTSSKTLPDEIASLKASLQKKERQIKDLKDTVDEAAKKFQEQEAAIAELRAKNASLEKKYANSVTGGNEELRLSEFDQEITLLKNENQELREKYAAAIGSEGASAIKAAAIKCEDTSASDSKAMDVDTTTTGASLDLGDGFKLIELESKIFELERSLETANQRVVEFQQQRDSALGQQRALERQVAELETKFRAETKAEETLARFTTEMEELKSAKMALMEKSKKLEEENREKVREMDELKKTLREFEEKRAAMEMELKTNQERAEALTTQKEAVEGTLRQNLEKMLEMQRKLKETEQTVAVVKGDKDRQSGEYEQRLQQLAATVSEAESESTRVRDLMQQFEKNMQESAEKSSKLESRAKELEDALKKMDAEKLEVKKLYEELAAKRNVDEKALVEKTAELEKVSSELNRLQASLKETEDKVEQDRRSSLEEGNRLRRELEDAKTSLVNVKKEKLELRESMKKVEDECKQLTRTLEAKEAELNQEKEKNTRLLTDMQKNEQAIQEYKVAIQKVDSVTDKYEEALNKKKHELEACQKELQNCREKYEISEKNFVLEQKKSMRFKSDLDLKTELEGKLKADLALIQTKLAEKGQESETLRKQLGEYEVQLRQMTQSGTAVASDMQFLKSSNELLTNVNEALKRDVQNREARLTEMETRLTSAKKQATELQQAASAKNKEFEELTRTYDESRKTVEQLELRYRNAEDERSSLVESVRQLKAENEKLSSTRLPPQAAGGGRKRGAKTTGQLENDNAEEVEVTPMASKPQRGAITRKKTGGVADTTAKEPSLEAEPPAGGRNTRGGGQRGKASGRTRKASEMEDGTSDTSAISGKSIPSSPKQAPKSQRKTKAAKEQSKHSSLLPFVDFSTEGPVTNTGRPQRRAAQEASDRMFALHEQFRTSGSLGGGTTDSDAMPSASTTVGPEVPLKKRRRELLKDPTIPVCSPADERPKLTVTEGVGLKKSNLKKK